MRSKQMFDRDDDHTRLSRRSRPRSVVVDERRPEPDGRRHEHHHRSKDAKPLLEPFRQTGTTLSRRPNAVRTSSVRVRVSLRRLRAPPHIAAVRSHGSSRAGVGRTRSSRGRPFPEWPFRYSARLFFFFELSFVRRPACFVRLRRTGYWAIWLTSFLLRGTRSIRLVSSIVLWRAPGCLWDMSSRITPWIEFYSRLAHAQSLNRSQHGPAPDPATLLPGN